MLAVVVEKIYTFDFFSSPEPVLRYVADDELLLFEFT